MFELCLDWRWVQLFAMAGLITVLLASGVTFAIWKLLWDDDTHPELVDMSSYALTPSQRRTAPAKQPATYWQPKLPFAS
jgi:hypothetical protein